MEREFAKFIYFICLLSITLFLLLEVIQFTSNQTQKTYNLKFTPPLKGTEILLEAEQKGGLKRGIWALDLGTEKARFLIPNGSRQYGVLNEIILLIRTIYTHHLSML